MPHLSHQRCWVGPEYWQVSITKSHQNELENLAWGSRYADLTATDTRKASIKNVVTKCDLEPSITHLKLDSVQ